MDERFSIQNTGLFNEISIISRRQILEDLIQIIFYNVFNAVCNIYSKYLNNRKL